MTQASLGIVFIHGIGKTEPGYSRNMQRGLEQRLTAAGVAQDDVAYQEIVWQDLVQQQQDFYFKHAQQTPIDYRKLREFVLSYFADATTYASSPNNGGTSKYELIHRRVHENMRDLEARLRPGGKLVIVAYSLGCHIMSNYVWDRQRGWLGGGSAAADMLATTAFQRLQTLTSFITLGCNLPLFVMGTTPYRPITVPAPGASPRGRWINLYDRDDVLGWPLCPLAADGPDALMEPADQLRFLRMVEDREVDVGALVVSATPLSHLGYFEDRHVLDPVAEHLVELLR